MAKVSLIHLYLLRALYLAIGVLMGAQVWPLIFHHRPWELMHGVANCMLAALTALALVGVRYPLQMLPLMFFELAWKAIWLIAIAWPAWSAGQVDADMKESIIACSMAVVIPFIIPWSYVIQNYVLKPGDRWR